jgi:predicted NUDIX family phosphoesterase
VDEEVLVIPADVLFRSGEWFGLRTDLAAFETILADPRSLEYRPRRIVETDPSVKQLIPYAVIRRGPDVFAYRRGKAGGENRLHDLWSIGVGGHICREDGAAGERAYQTGFLRELDEEVEIVRPYRDRIVGLLYDPRTAVGSVHLGVVHLVDVDGAVTARDPSLADAGFRTLASLLAEQESLETWSQFVVDPLAAGRL